VSSVFYPLRRLQSFCLAFTPRGILQAAPLQILSDTSFVFSRASVAERCKSFGDGRFETVCGCVGHGGGVLFSVEKTVERRDFGWVLKYCRKICRTAPKFALHKSVLVNSPEVQKV
jgi:hypothetical protein